MLFEADYAKNYASIMQWRIQDLSHGGGGGGAWNSKTPKLVIATRSRRGPALAPSRGVRGHAPPGNFENWDAQICIFHYFWVQFQKNQRVNLQGNLYINLQFLQNIWSHWEDQKKDVQHEENHASNGRPSNIFFLLLLLFIYVFWPARGARVPAPPPPPGSAIA